MQTQPSQTLKTMKLYSQVERIHAELSAEGYGPDDALPIEVLTRYDQLHYFGTDAVDHAIAAVGIGADSLVLDIGSGLGGPARHVAATVGAQVHAIELQEDMHATAADLTARASLAGSIDHICGDAVEIAYAPAAADAVISFLALYHIPARARLYGRLCEALRPGGRLYVEDLFARRPLSEVEHADMNGMLAAGTLPDRDGYLAELQAAGFTDIQFEDMTDAWAAFTGDRLARFRAGREARSTLLGPDLVAELEAFYDTIARLLAAGNVGGVRICASRPA